jgi:SWI/SNF-related matrix-associated actin-dependent regulator 1 of chromatin subfamily A
MHFNRTNVEFTNPLLLKDLFENQVARTLGKAAVIFLDKKLTYDELNKRSNQLAKNIPHVIALTGTPVLSRPAEVFTTLNIIDPKVWNNYYNFAVRYCAGKQGYWGFEAKGASNLDDLRKRISPYFLRRTKEEVLKELPPKVWTTIPIELSDEDRKQYEMVEQNLIRYLKTYKKEKSDKDIMKSMQAEKLVRLNILREVNTMAKVKQVKEIIEGIIESGEKVLVFSSFNGPLIELQEMFQDESVMIIGSTPVDERGVSVARFQKDPDTKVFLGGYKSAGAGITLTAASNIILIDAPWTPADIEQSVNRAHRPGAEYESLNIYTIKSRDTIDGFMHKLLDFKQRIVDQVVGNKEKEEEANMIDAYLKEIEAKYKEHVEEE